MNRLYNEYAASTVTGGILSDKIAKVIFEFLDAYPDADLNDIENIVGQTAGAVLAEKRLRHALAMRKAARQKS